MALLLDLGLTRQVLWVDRSRDGVKAIRWHGALDWVKMGEQSKAEGWCHLLFPNAGLLKFIYYRGSDIFTLHVHNSTVLFLGKARPT